MTRFERWAADAADFAGASADWGDLDHYAAYTSAGGGWEESCDNNIGGLDVSWAFRLSREEIKEKAPIEFHELLKLLIQQGIDEGYDEEQWQYILDWLD